ncbi:hypothetical protein EXS71_02020 [Candidatus Uhrbacteria bacterium]|nr:hypothetical protein [Candidatus Uhrbacteria bacterium]
MQKMSGWSVQPEILSIGGGIFVGIIFFFSILLVVAYQLSSGSWMKFFLWLMLVGSLLYLADNMREELTLTDQKIIFSRWHRSSISIDLSAIREIHLIHEGFNLKPGMESLSIKMQDGSDRHMPLGSLWRKRELEQFLQAVYTQQNYGKKNKTGKT